MAAPDRQPPVALNKLGALTTEPHRFEFASAMRLIECAFRDRPRLGRSVRPGDDAVRLAQQPHLTFAAGALAAFSPGGPGNCVGTLRVFMLGLLGPNGPLPLHLTEYVLDRLRRHEDPTLRSFLDLFHHRLLSLFWRATANGQPTVELDRPEQDRFTRYFGSLAGFGNPATAAREPGVDRARRHWIGHFARQVRNAEGLQALIAGYFGMQVRAEEFIGRWLPIPGRERTRLSPAATPTLGANTFLGDSIWDCSQTIRLICGPLDLHRYQRLLPGGESWTRLEELVRSYIGFELAWEVRFVLEHAEVPPLQLSSTARLGWTSWLGRPLADRDAGDLLLQPDRPYRHHAQPRSETLS